MAGSALLAALRQREALHPIETAKNERRFISIDAVPRTESTGEFVKLYCCSVAHGGREVVETAP